MRLNGTGRAAGRGHVDGVALVPPWPGASCTDCCWREDDLLIAQWFGDGRAACLMQQRGGGAWELADADGAEWLRAAGGNWGSLFGKRGTLRRNEPPELPDLEPCDADWQDGAIVCERHSTGSNVVLVRGGGILEELATAPLRQDAVAGAMARRRGGTLLWGDAAGWHLRAAGAAVAALNSPVAGLDYAVPVPLPTGRLLVLERGLGRLTLREHGQRMGWVLAVDQSPTGLVAPDARAYGALVRAAWSAGQGEQPHEFRTADVDPASAPPVDLGAPWQPLPEPDIPPWGRAVPHWAYFTFDAGRGYGNHPQAVLHAAWCATAADVAEANTGGFPVIASAELLRLAATPVMCIISNDYKDAPPLEQQLPAALALCAELKAGLVAFDEGDWQAFPPSLPPGAFCGFKAFRDPGPEDLGKFKDRVRTVARRVKASGRRRCIVPGVDDRLQTLQELHIIEGEQQVVALVREEALEMVAPFSYARAATLPDGTTTGGGILHPTAWRWAQASAAASQPVDWAQFRLSGAPAPFVPKAKVYKGGNVKIAIKSRVTGKYGCCEPGNPSGGTGESAFPVVFNRDGAGAWETLTLEKVGDVFYAEFDETKRALCLRPEGKWETRPHGTRGPWEALRATTQPDGPNFLYRRDGNKLCDVVEFVEV